MSPTVRHAIVGVDFSPATELCLSAVSELSSLGIEQLTLVYVMDTQYPMAPNPAHLPHYEERLRQLAAPLKEQGMRVDVQARIGAPVRELLEAGRESGPALILIGSHGQGMVAEAALGSTSAALIQQSTLPVLILAVEACDGTRACRLVRPDLSAHLLHATDFSDVAERAYGYVAAFADSVRAITLLHVQDPRRAGREQRDNVKEYDRLDRARLDRMLVDLKQKGAGEVRLRIEYGNPEDKILELAEEEDVSLIVLGSQGRGYLSEVMLGSTSRHVARNARRSVLLVPAPR